MTIHIRIFRDTDGALIARVDEYPELLASGFSPAELREALEEQIEFFAERPAHLPADAFDGLALPAERELALV